MFGPLSIGAGRDKIGPRDLGGIKPKQLLEILLLERGRIVAKDRLADALWGDALPVSAVSTIETYVSVVRRRVPLGRELISTVQGGYRVEAARVAVDVDEFDAAASAGAAGETQRRYVDLSRAVELGCETVLADEPYAEWVLPIRRQYADRWLQSLVQLAECCLALGRFDEALAHGTTALTTDPLLERAGRAVMLADYALGDRSAALTTYATLRGALADELGAVPTLETTELHRGVREAQPLDLLLTSTSCRGPAIRFAGNGDVRLAYQTFGRDQPDIVFVPQFLTNLGATWDEPVYAAFLRRLGSVGQVTIFDKRGSGLSDPVVEWPDKGERCEDMRAVMDAAGVQRATLFGVCDGGAMCVRFAARYPERVAGLVLFGVPARLLACPGFEWGWSEEFHASFLAAFEAAWARGDGLELMDPSVAFDRRYRALFARLLRLGASPGMARRLLEADRDLDLRDLLPKITAPTLVLTRRDDPWVRAENSFYMAEHLPSAELMVLDGADHEPWLGDSDDVIAALAAFLPQLPIPIASAP